MQCFQKDPNLRVSSRKLLKHAWIVGSRRSDAPVAKPPANFSEAVEEVKQWNEALKSPTGAGSFRASTRSNAASPMPPRRDPPLRDPYSDQRPATLITPAKGPLQLAKPKNQADAFRSPESPGMSLKNISEGASTKVLQKMITGTMILRPPSLPVHFIYPNSSPMITLAACYHQIA